MLWTLPICFLRRSSSASPLISQLVPSPGVYSVTYRAQWKSTYCSACVWLMKRVRQTLCNQEQGLIGLGRVHLADCKRVSRRQGHAADGQFASDFQASAKPFRSFGSRAPSGSSFDVLQMAVAATETLHPNRPRAYFQAAFTLAGVRGQPETWVPGLRCTWHQPRPSSSFHFHMDSSLKMLFF